MKFIILTGPTGIGKTKLSIKLASYLDTDIISADSMQIYKGMNIATDKISKEDAEGINHHLIDIVSPDEDFTVQDFKAYAMPIIEELNSNNKIPLIVGGTGLYIDSLIYDMNFTIAPPNKYIRSYYEEIADKHGNKFLHDILAKVDPISAEKNHPNQRQRIIRALEVFDYSGKSFSSFDNGRKYNDKADFIYLVLNRDREKLYERINSRVDKMVDQGLVEEVRSLIDKGYGKDLQSMQAIGYKEIISFLEDEISFEESVDLIKRNSRRYAKRQLSWFRREKSAEYIYIREEDTLDDLLKKCLKVIEAKYGHIK